MVAEEGAAADRVEARPRTGSGSTRRAIRATCAASCSPAWRTCRWTSPTDHATTTAEQPRRYGRGVFLAAVVGGVSSLYWGKAAWGHVSRRRSRRSSRSRRSFRRRLADLHGRRPMPRFDPATWRLTIGGLVEQPVVAHLRRAARAAAGRAGLDLPLRHRLDGEERPLGRRPDRTTCSPPPSRSRRRTRSSSSRPRSPTSTT